MNDKPSFRPFLVSTLILFVGGWGGLVLLLNFSLPTLWPRWALYALIVLTATGTFIPIFYWFNKTFFSNSQNIANVIVRESVAAGVYFALLTWLSIGRALNLPLAIWLGLGLLFIEYLLRLREAASKSENDSPQHSIR
jgi:hypothetical protein